MEGHASRSALVFWGGWPGHEPEAFARRYADQLRGSDFGVRIVDSLEILADEDAMASFDLVVPCWTLGAMTKEEEEGLVAAVRAGAGIAGAHGGMGDTFYENLDYQFMIGGRFVWHPRGKIEIDVRVTDPGHPVMKGIEPFQIATEFYYLHCDPSNNVLAEATFWDAALPQNDVPWIDGCVMPVAWTRTYGAGRVFYSSLGHYLADLDVPEVADLHLQGLLWAARDARADAGMAA